jgi:hypothetical protein
MNRVTSAIERVGQWHRVRDVVLDRVAGLPSWVVLTQLFIGLGWLRAVAEKVIEPGWWTGHVIDDFVVDHQHATLGWYQPFVEGVVTPAAPVIALAVVLGQLVAAISLTTGKRLLLGLSVGMFLNLNFLAAGAVTPSAFYLLAQGAIALWMAELKPSAAATRALGAVAATAIFLAAASLPFVSTVHPHDVIEDPAVMFAFGGSLAAAACWLASHTTRTQSPPTPARALVTTPAGSSGAFTSQIQRRSSI